MDETLHQNKRWYINPSQCYWQQLENKIAKLQKTYLQKRCVDATELGGLKLQGGEIHPDVSR